MNLHLSGCTQGGGEALRRSVPRLATDGFFCVVCVFLKMTGGEDALVATGLLHHVNLYFMMSCCSREVGHGTRSRSGRGGGCNAKGPGQEQLCPAI